MFREKKSICTRRQAFTPVTEEEKEEYKRAYLLRYACDLYKKNGKKINELEKLIDEELASDKFNSFKEITKNELREEVKTLLNKFITVSPEVSLSVAQYEFSYGGMDFVVSPDYVYNLGEKEIDTEKGKLKLPVVKYVDFTTGRQGLSSKIKVKDFYTRSVYYSVKTLGLVEFAKNHLQGNGVAIISFTALKTSNDHNGDYSRDWSVAKDDKSGGFTNNEVYTSVCFVDGKPVTFTGSSVDFNSVYRNFDETLEVFKNGKDLKGTSDCENCEYNNICNFAYPPIKKPVVATKKVAKSYNVTPEQAKLIDFAGGIAVVDAGAGSGKSQSVALHTIKLFERGIKPDDIMLLSFSNSAVAVLKERVKNMVEDFGYDIDVSPMKIATFNGLGDEVIKEYYQDLGFVERPRLIDSIENYDLILQSIDWNNPIEGFDYRNPNMYLNKLVKGVGKAFEELFADIRQNNLDKDGFIQKNSFEPQYEQVWKAYKRYERLMKGNNYYDYSDQSNLVMKLLEDNPYLLTDLYSPKVIIVDEFQDSNDYQLEFLKALSLSSSFEELLVVGDSSQAIYGFRGTSPENIISFEEKTGFPCEDLKLTVNHRSAKEIVYFGNEISKYAGSLEANNKMASKVMTSSRDIFGEVKFSAYLKSDEEISSIASKIKDLIDSGEKPEDIAVLSHNKPFLNKMRKALGELEIRSQFDMKERMIDNYRVLSAIGLAEFIQSQTTKGLLEFLNAFYGNSLINKSSDEVEIILNKNMTAFKYYYELDEEAQKIEVILNLLKCLDNNDDAVYSAFLEMISNKEGYTSDMLLSYIIKIKKYNSEEGALKDGEYEAVALSTVHSSKGKEWKHVFGTLSDFNKDNTRDAETYRLIYVLVTRACDTLEVSCVHDDKAYNNSPNFNNLFSGIMDFLNYPFK